MSKKEIIAYAKALLTEKMARKHGYWKSSTGGFSKLPTRMKRQLTYVTNGTGDKAYHAEMLEHFVARMQEQYGV
tara:strand:- start:86 stop:307 length:222 start_codon:yes stop_codon:yes gene_type:complete